MELKIGNLYWIWRINKISGKPNFIGEYYYVGRGMFCDEISPLFERTPIKADVAVPIDNDDVEAIPNYGGNRIVQVKIKNNSIFSKYRIDNAKIIDIEPKYLNEFDWWHEFVKKYNLK